MNVLITGASGFVGSALIMRLLPENIQLTAAVQVGESGVALPAGVKRAVVPPLSEACDFSAALQGIDCVIHLAARVHIMHDSSGDPVQEFRRVNLHGTEQLARQAAQAGVQRFIFISTVKVHGEETATPYREDSPIAPLDPYGASKAEAEAALWRIAGKTGLEVVIIRPPLVYGPGVKANFLQLMRLIARGIPLPFATISNRRSLVYIGNLVDALTCCISCPGAAGQVFLISDGTDVSTPELIRQTAAALNTPARLFPLPVGLLQIAGRFLNRSSAVERLVGTLQVDSSKIRKVLGWRPPFTMAAGLEATAAWFSDNSTRADQ